MQNRTRRFLAFARLPPHPDRMACSKLTGSVVFRSGSETHETSPTLHGAILPIKTANFGRRMKWFSLGSETNRRNAVPAISAPAGRHLGSPGVSAPGKEIKTKIPHGYKFLAKPMPVFRAENATEKFKSVFLSHPSGETPDRQSQTPFPFGEVLFTDKKYPKILRRIEPAVSLPLPACPHILTGWLVPFSRVQWFFGQDLKRTKRLPRCTARFCYLKLQTFECLTGQFSFGSEKTAKPPLTPPLEKEGKRTLRLYRLEFCIPPSAGRRSDQRSVRL